jgi:hypothetical protein
MRMGAGCAMTTTPMANFTCCFGIMCMLLARLWYPGQCSPTYGHQQQSLSVPLLGNVLLSLRPW